MQQRIKCIEYLYIVLPLAFLILATIGTIFQFIQIASSHHTRLSPYLSISRNINTSLTLTPISEIFMIPSFLGACPRGSKLFGDLAQWKGTKQGCYNLKNGTLLEKRCPNLQLTNHTTFSEWRNIRSFSIYNLGIWNNYRFCVKRIQNFRKRTPEVTHCPIGFQVCSPEYCVSQLESCPLTSIKLVVSPNGRYISLQAEREYNESPIISLSASPYGTPCVNPLSLPRSNTSSLYPLEMYKAQGCDKFGSDSALKKAFDEMDLKDFYLQNLMDPVFKELPNFEEFIGEEKVGLYYESKIKIGQSPACQRITGMLSIIISRLETFSFGDDLSVVLIAYNIILVVFGFVMFFYMYCDKDEQRDRYYREQKCLFHTFHFLPYVLAILYIIQYSNIPNGGGPKAEYLLQVLDIVIDQQCFATLPYQEVYTLLKRDVLDITVSFFWPVRIMGILSYLFFGLMLLTRGVRGYYLIEVQKFEKIYLDTKFAASRTDRETELVSGQNHPDLPRYHEDMDEDYETHSSSPYYHYQDQEQ